jgi:hypothetical protein
MMPVSGIRSRFIFLTFRAEAETVDCRESGGGAA